MRRMHKKSRNGCSDCKTRRVKCDERKPICGRCQKNGLTCSLAFLTSSLASARAKTGRSPQSQELHPSLAPHSLDSNSLELLHHYTTIACFTMGSERNMYISEKVIPQLAMTDHFLMLGMLSVSALHLAYLLPQRRAEFVQRGFTCKQLALNHYNKHVSIDDPKQVHSALAFGGLVVPYMLASRATDTSVGRIPSLNDSEPHWFHVIRGLVQLTIKAWPHLLNGPFSPLLSKAKQPIIPENNPDDHRLVKLFDMLDQSAMLSTAEEQRALDICRDTLRELRRVASVPFSECKKLGVLAVINIWPGTISHEFVYLLHRRQPEALVILAHYCVLLKKVNMYWYLEGVGSQMLEEIAKTLGHEWLPWIEWAMEQREVEVIPDHVVELIEVTSYPSICHYFPEFC